MSRKLLTKKEHISDEAFVSSDVLLKEFKDKIELKKLHEQVKELETLIKDILSCDEENIRKALLKKRVFNINNPIDISSSPDIESHIETPGALYYDSVNDRLRLRTKSGWITK